MLRGIDYIHRWPYWPLEIATRFGVGSDSFAREPAYLADEAGKLWLFWTSQKGWAQLASARIGVRLG